MAPRRIAAHELRDTREEHQAKQQPPQEPAHPGRGRPVPDQARREPGRRVQHRQQPGLEQQPVPLEPEECLARDAERQIADPEEQQDGNGRDAGDEQKRQRGATPGEQPQHAVARADPAEGGKQAVGRAAVLRMDPLEERSCGQDPMFAKEARDLHRQRHKGDQVDGAEQTEEEPAGEQPGGAGGVGRTGGPRVGDVHRCAPRWGPILIEGTRPRGEPYRAFRCSTPASD